MNPKALAAQQANKRKRWRAVLTLAAALDEFCASDLEQRIHRAPAWIWDGLRPSQRPMTVGNFLRTWEREGLVERLPAKPGQRVYYRWREED